MEQRFVFNEVADIYDRARPGYPQAVFDDVMALAGVSPGDAALEIGCGTGKATEDFARRGLHVVALEPGPEMIGAARRRLSGFANISLVETTFETWPAEPAAFKLVAAAQSWHWVAPQVRFIKAAEALAPGGALAVFGNAPVGLPSPLRTALERLHESHAPHLAGPLPENWYLPSGPIAGLFVESQRFGPVTHKAYAWSRTQDASSYLDLLRSTSRYQILDAPIREALLEAIADAIEAHGGRFDLAYETHLYLARRRD